jgi:RNA polymerase sigma-70 factor (ECF subfamily)
MHTGPTLRLVDDRSPPPVDDGSRPPVDDLEAVFRSYSGYVAAIALRLLGRDAEVDDVVQEVFVVALKGLRHMREPAAIKGWLATVAVRMARRRLRRRRLRSFLGLEADPDYAQVVVAASQDHALVIRRAYQVLDRLPVNDKIAWMLRHVEGEQLDEVARLCGCSLATAKRRIAAAQAALDEELGE